MVRRIFGWPRLDGRECPSAIGRFCRSPLPVVVISFHQICLLCDMFWSVLCFFSYFMVSPPPVSEVLCLFIFTGTRGIRLIKATKITISLSCAGMKDRGAPSMTIPLHPAIWRFSYLHDIARLINMFTLLNVHSYCMHMCWYMQHEHH